MLFAPPDFSVAVGVGFVRLGIVLGDDRVHLLNDLLDSNTAGEKNAEGGDNNIGGFLSNVVGVASLRCRFDQLPHFFLKIHHAVVELWLNAEAGIKISGRLGKVAQRVAGVMADRLSHGYFKSRMTRATI